MALMTPGITELLDHFVERQVSSGRYSNASEIVREALRLLEQESQERRAKLRALRMAAKQGFDEIDQGQGVTLGGDKAVKQFVKQIAAEVRSRAARKRG
jgi:antitoxin ParD1/3/4